MACGGSRRFGGPDDYSTQLGYERMLAHHRELRITPDQPEFRAAFVGYVEWGTRLALNNSRSRRRGRRARTPAPLGLGRRAALPAVLSPVGDEEAAGDRPGPPPRGRCETVSVRAVTGVRGASSCAIGRTDPVRPAQLIVRD